MKFNANAFRHVAKMATMTIYEACIGGLPVSYIPGSKQESIP